MKLVNERLIIAFWLSLIKLAHAIILMEVHIN